MVRALPALRMLALRWRSRLSAGVFRLSMWHMLAGGLPDAWGAPGAFPNLRTLALKGSGLQGPLPPAWGNSSDALPALTILTIDSNKLTGTLPAAWSQGFASLS